jgi:hypothetical protein
LLWSVTAGSNEVSVMTPKPNDESSSINPSAAGIPARLPRQGTIFSGPWHAATPFSAMNW